jgi:hypothetical protein
MSWEVILDLSHSALPRSAAAIANSGVVCLVCLRGGINNGRAAQLEQGGALRNMGTRGDFSQEEAEQRREGKCERRKTMTLNKGVLNRRTVDEEIVRSTRNL